MGNHISIEEFNKRQKIRDLYVLWLKRFVLTSFLGYVLWAGFYVRIGAFEFLTFGLKYHIERAKSK